MRSSVMHVYGQRGPERRFLLGCLQAGTRAERPLRVRPPGLPEGAGKLRLRGGPRRGRDPELARLGRARRSSSRSRAPGRRRWSLRLVRSEGSGEEFHARWCHSLSIRRSTFAVQHCFGASVNDPLSQIPALLCNTLPARALSRAFTGISPTHPPVSERA